MTKPVHTTLISLLLAVVGTLLLAPATDATADDLITLNFDGKPAQWSGVTQTGGVVTAAPITHSGTGVLRPSCGLTCPDALTLTFPTGQVRVSAWLGYTVPGLLGAAVRQVTGVPPAIVLEALDGSGHVVTSVSTEVPATGSASLVQPAALTSAEGLIRALRARVENGDTGGLLLDDVQFEPAAPALDVSTRLLDLGTVQLGAPQATGTVTVVDTGNTSASVRTVLDGDPGFVVLTDQCSGRPLASQASCDITVGYTATAGGRSRGTLQILDVRARRLLVNLTATAVTAPPPPVAGAGATVDAASAGPPSAAAKQPPASGRTVGPVDPRAGLPVGLTLAAVGVLGLLLVAFARRSVRVRARRRAAAGRATPPRPPLRIVTVAGQSDHEIRSHGTLPGIVLGYDPAQDLTVTWTRSEP